MSNNKAKRSNMNAFEYAAERGREEAARREALSRFIRENGGFVVSVPGKKILRIEIEKTSALPSKLTEAGYRPIMAGSTMRTTTAGLQQFDIIEIDVTGR